MLSDKEEDKMSIVSKVKTQSGIKGERRKEKSKKQDKAPYENRIFENKTLLVGKYPILNKEKHRSIYWVSHSSALTRQSQ